MATSSEKLYSYKEDISRRPGRSKKKTADIQKNRG